LSQASNLLHGEEIGRSKNEVIINVPLLKTNIVPEYPGENVEGGDRLLQQFEEGSRIAKRGWTVFSFRRRSSTGSSKMVKLPRDRGDGFRSKTQQHEGQGDARQEFFQRVP